MKLFRRLAPLEFIVAGVLLFVCMGGAYAAWKYNTFTGKLDYYGGNISTAGANGAAGNLTKFGGTHNITNANAFEDSNGNIGIGTTVPTGYLHVAGGTAQSSIAEGLAVNDASGGDADDDLRVETNAEDNHFVVDASADATLIGDFDTNYTQFAVDGTQTMVGTARVTKYAWMNAGGLGLGNDNPAAQDVNAAGYAILVFADAADDYAEANIKIPGDMDFSADSYICVGWSIPATETNMTWGFGYLITALNGDTEGAATTGVLEVASSAVADGLVVSPIITISGGTIDADDVCIHVYVYRDVSAEALGTEVDMHGMALKYTASKLGE